MGTPQKLDLDQADVEVGGILVTSAISIEWSPDYKSGDTVKGDELVSTSEAKEQIKGKLDLEQWEAGALEQQLREGPTVGTLSGIRTSINIADRWGRYVKASLVRFSKGGVKWDQKAADDKTSLAFEVVGKFEAKIDGGN